MGEGWVGVNVDTDAVRANASSSIVLVSDNRSFSQDAAVEAVMDPPAGGGADQVVDIFAPHRIDRAFMLSQALMHGIIMHLGLGGVAGDGDAEIHHVMVGGAAIGALAHM